LFEGRVVVAFLQASLFDRSLACAGSKRPCLSSSDWQLLSSNNFALLGSQLHSVHARKEVQMHFHCRYSVFDNKTW